VCCVGYRNYVKVFVASSILEPRDEFAEFLLAVTFARAVFNASIMPHFLQSSLLKLFLWHRARIAPRA